MSRILIVEDDQDIASFIKRGLEAEGYVCDIADNGALALGLAQSNTYQLVVLDLSLPLLDGTDVLTKLRGSRRGCPGHRAHGPHRFERPRPRARRRRE